MGDELELISAEDMLIVSVTLPMKEVEPEVEEDGLEEGEEGADGEEGAEKTDAPSGEEKPAEDTENQS